MLHYSISFGLELKPNCVLHPDVAVGKIFLSACHSNTIWSKYNTTEVILVFFELHGNRYLPKNGRPEQGRKFGITSAPIDSSSMPVEGVQEEILDEEYIPPVHHLVTARPM